MLKNKMEIFAQSFILLEYEVDKSFAFLPVRLEDGRKAWLKHVYRVKCANSLSHDGWSRATNASGHLDCLEEAELRAIKLREREKARRAKTKEDIARLDSLVRSASARPQAAARTLGGGADDTYGNSDRATRHDSSGDVLGLTAAGAMMYSMSTGRERGDASSDNSDSSTDGACGGD